MALCSAVTVFAKLKAACTSSSSRSLRPHTRVVVVAVVEADAFVQRRHGIRLVVCLVA